jgi:recombinational DNA repair protein RecT
MTDPQHPAVRFRATIESVAASQLADAAETPEGRQTLARFGAAFAAAARQARDPSAFYNADPASIASAAVLSLQTGLTPGGPMPEVFLVPRGRELQWSVTHRGLMRLARKAGWTVRAVVVHVRDLPSVELVDGQVRITAQDPANYVQD